MICQVHDNVNFNVFILKLLCLMILQKTTKLKFYKIYKFNCYHIQANVAMYKNPNFSFNKYMKLYILHNYINIT